MDIYKIADIWQLMAAPEDEDKFNSWVQQNDIIPFLENEINDEFIILYASSQHLFIHAALIPCANYNKSEAQDLLQWSCNPYSSWSQVYPTLSSEKCEIEPPLSRAGSHILAKGEQLIFGRQFLGVKAKCNYYEFNQKIAHLMGIHFMPERNAWCCLDRFGDIADIVKIFENNNSNENEGYIVICINKQMLANYEKSTNTMLVRMFECCRYNSGEFNGWNNSASHNIISFDGTNNIFGCLTVEPGYASNSRGIQLIAPTVLLNDSTNELSEEGKKEYVTYISYDWKNDTIKEVSCDPKCLGNYHRKSDLPFGTSPVFFKPDVLSKYKNNTEKYTLTERTINCRGSWYLQSYDINEAGQVHTYLIYLSKLPYEEQLYWKSFNERPKIGISKRAYTTDFMGSPYTDYNPLQSLKTKLASLNVNWWKLRDQDLLTKVQYPITDSYDEWSNDILNLDQLLIEGFEEKFIRNKLKSLGKTPDNKLRSLKLIEEYLITAGFEEAHAKKLMSPYYGLHDLRSKVKGHAISRNTKNSINEEVLKKFGTFRKHFENLCAECDESFEIIMNSFEN